MKGYLLRLAVLLAAFTVGVACVVLFRPQTARCLPLDPPDSHVRILDKTTGKALRAETCPR